MTADGVDVVCLNGGSSSVKGARYRVRGGTEERIGEASIDGLTTTDDGSSVRDAATHVFRRLLEKHGCRRRRRPPGRARRTRSCGHPS